MPVNMSDSQGRAAYEYRAFLLKVSEKLSDEDSKRIVFLEDLPVQELENKPPLTVLTHLEMRGKLSASKPEDLVEILRKIGRQDLAKKVRDFAKQRKGRATLSSLLGFSDHDHPATKLSANLQVTLLLCGILLEQVENLREEAKEVGFKRVEEVVADARSLVSEHLKRKLLYASGLISQESKEQAACSERPESTPSSPDSPLSSLELEVPPIPVQSAQPPQHAGCARLSHTVNDSELKAAIGNLKSQSLPRSRGKCRGPVQLEY